MLSGSASTSSIGLCRRAPAPASRARPMTADGGSCARRIPPPGRIRRLAHCPPSEGASAPSPVAIPAPRMRPRRRSQAGGGSPGCSRKIETGVQTNGAQVIVERVVVRFAWLGHQIGDVDPHRVDARNRRRDAFDEQVGNDARVETSGADDDPVCIDQRAQDVRTADAGWARATGDEFSGASRRWLFRPVTNLSRFHLGPQPDVSRSSAARDPEGPPCR